MIERQHGQMCIMCDECEDNLDFFANDEFNQMIADAKDKGWQIVNSDQGTWIHRCPSCKPDRVSEARRKFGIA